MKKYVSYHNYINNFGLKDFNETDLDIFFFIIKEIDNKQDAEVVIPFGKIKKETKVTIRNSHGLAEKLSGIISKLMKITLVNEKFNEKGEIYKEEFVIFQSYIVDEENRTLTVSCSDKAIFLFNDLTGNFTKLDFQNYLSISSKYIKEIYRRLKQFDSTKFWKVTYQNFLEVLSIPKSYKTSVIKKQIIDASIIELKKFYPHLRVFYDYDNETGKRGRPKIKTITFDFSKETKKVNGKTVNKETGEILESKPVNISKIINSNIQELSQEERDLLLKQLLFMQMNENENANKTQASWASEETHEILNRKFSRP